MHKGRLRSILLVLWVVNTAGTAAWSAPAGDGILSGQVVSRTPPARPVAGVEVALSTFADGVEEANLTAVTDRTGRFTFRGLVRGPGRTYTVTVRYKGGEYTVEQVTFATAEVVKIVPVTVYEPTTNEAVLRVVIHHLIVTPGQGALRIMEMLRVANPADRTFIGGRPAPGDRRETLRFPLPAGATDVQYLDGLMECCVVKDRDGFIDTMDVKPGVRQVAFSYTLPVRGNAARVERLLVYPTDAVEVLVADVGVKVSGQGLVARQSLVTPEAQYLRLSGAALRAGSSVVLDLAGLGSGSRSGRWVATGVALGVLVLGLLVALRRSAGAAAATPITAGEGEMQPIAPTPEETQPVAPAAAETRAALLEELADLDERFAAGGIPKAEYTAERARKKRVLVDLLRAARDSSGTPG